MRSGSGLELAAAFYREAVRPVLEHCCPGVAHSAARIGTGSEVLGYDDRVSQDHDWGPRLELFLHDGDRAACAERLLGALSAGLPPTFRGYPTSFALDVDGVGVLAETEPGAPVAHRVEVRAVGEWCRETMGFDPRRGIGWFDWLAVSSHRLAEVTAGAVFHDGLGELGPIRAALSYYPDDVWLFILAAQWTRISQEEAFVARCAQVGDDLGSGVVASRMVREIMRLCLIMDRRYIPYSKWLGSAFRSLEVSGILEPHLTAALHATDGEARQRHLGAAYELVAERHNALGVTDPVDPSLRPFWARRFPVILGQRFARALHQAITDPQIRALPLVGSVDQFLDSTDVLCAARLTRAAADGVLRRVSLTTLPPSE